MSCIGAPGQLMEPGELSINDRHTGEIKPITQSPFTPPHPSLLPLHLNKHTPALLYPSVSLSLPPQTSLY